MEAVLTLGLVSVILGTASGAQQVGLFGALGVGGYIALAGLWASPISGASMNPVRTFGPDIVSADFTSWWVYLAGPLLGAVLAVGMAFLLRGPGGGTTGSLAAQGIIHPRITRPGQALSGPAASGQSGRGRSVRRRACRGRRRARWTGPHGPRPGRPCRRAAARR